MSNIKIFQTKVLLILVLFICVILFVCFFYYFKINNNTELIANVVNFSAQEKSNVSLPVRLKIPNLNIDTSFEFVGLTPDGAMDAPQGPDNVGWFSLGPPPGEIGSAVIDGHSGYKDNIPAVFDNLYKLEKGDKIYIENEKGETLVFIVRELRTYNPRADTLDIFTSSDGKAHLNLITCTGIWNKILKSHSDRLVVFTDLEVI
ncbi:MAG: class F sortase [Candidatus Parcubacteria bacterium]|nr:class F sortase [Candidatus Parcubacteria bacterium]